MTSPASAIANKSSIDVGYNANVALYSPLFTRRSSSSNPRIPPTKSIRESERDHVFQVLGLINDLAG